MRTEQDPSLVLNQHELDVLRLLASGHTAKSIAERSGLSVNAVNDRLREARRKTGVGSSRELARLIATQENWAEKIEVPSGAPVDQTEHPEAGLPTARSIRRKAVIVVPAVILALSVIAWHQHSKVNPFDPAITATTDLVIEALGSSIQDPRTLHAALKAEQLDPVWAERMETLLTRTYAPALTKTSLAGAVRVQCGRTLCEVYAVHHQPSSSTEEVRLKQALGAPIFRNLEEAGLVNRGLNTSSDDGPNGRLSFVTYWQGPPRP
ncbi:putative DNA-binding CsgD family transcriptional regulator [Sphingomonas sp. T1]|uniref:helix-turn-helix transcriptional regulator n=1 Tax=Sphingomonas sp. T1 TaxID=2653172 RepID=UPI0012F2C891|nr:helix-turn-helix transcriptional regulator [Sphingomonas sp. T1]VXC98537.1 putative DNA-binding CsgD family transcriptional regulator [Sphingomonas sp. T1]